MKKTILILIFCLFTASGISLAQNNIEGMRILTVTAMMRYGQTLYDRGDFNDASAVFNHVLAYDSHQPLALKYLKDMGYWPVRPEPEHQISNPVPVDLSDTQSLKTAIEAQKQLIEKLRTQIMQMRENIAAQSIDN